ncbi:ABC transporter permease [Agrococcus sp. Ld7]|uniref:ABC transporter permease n=1 Tax=Agrococcus sp. Ld7 TaxID=649148 RepID=UPI003869985C
MADTDTSKFSALSTRAIATMRQPEAQRAKRSSTGMSGLLLALAPAFLVLAVFYFYPMLSVLVAAFTDPQPGTQNFEWFFGQPVNVDVLWRTIAISFWVMVICVLVAYPFAYFMTSTSPTIRSVLMLAVLVPFLTSAVVRTFAWVLLLQDSGPIGDFAALFGVDQLGVLRTPTAVLIGMAQVLLPFVVLPMYSTMAQVDRRLLTAAQSLGATRRKAFFAVYLPLSLPGVAAGALLCFVMALGFYITPAMLGSARETFLSTLIQGQVQNLGQWGHGAVIGLVLLLVTLTILSVAALIGRRAGGDAVANMVGGSKA